ncbi:hypothetical protein [Moorena sp. SIO4G3]|uniref:hypothetical protein n=1 Tax=Moorena sp. SIO4G3 TaxID=2607821 RepID=UPI00142C84B4|nr:hypothetical protein [Moorena sp. SIO4G3]NEO76718.1 hypothetical protein [Moorena sp. SIO4G3]
MDKQCVPDSYANRRSTEIVKYYYYSRFPIPDSLFPIPYSLLPTPYSLLLLTVAPILSLFP